MRRPAEFAPKAVRSAGAIRHYGRRWTGRADITGFDVEVRVRAAGLRPTRQRVSLGWLLFAKGDRHVSAEMLFEEAMKARVPVSLATVYNTLHQFTQAGLLRELAIDGAKTYFDTDNSDHHHFVVDGENTVIDIPATGGRRRRTAGAARGLRDRPRRRGRAAAQVEA